MYIFPTYKFLLIINPVFRYVFQNVEYTSNRILDFTEHSRKFIQDQTPGGSFSNVPKSFRTRKATAKSHIFDYRAYLVTPAFVI